MKTTLWSGAVAALIAGYGVYDYARPVTAGPTPVLAGNTADMDKEPPESKNPCDLSKNPPESKNPCDLGTLLD